MNNKLDQNPYSIRKDTTFKWERYHVYYACMTVTQKTGVPLKLSLSIARLIKTDFLERIEVVHFFLLLSSTSLAYEKNNH